MKHVLLLTIALAVAGCVREEASVPPPAPPSPAPPPAPPPPPAAPGPSDVITGGADWDTAVELKFDDKLTAKWTCKIGPPQYYKFAGKAGYRVSLRTSSTETFHKELSDGDRRKVAGNFQEKGEIDWLHAGGRASDTFYVKIWRMHGNALAVACELALQDNTDAGGGGDAGGELDDAFAVDAAEVKGWVAGINDYQGSDSVDCYRVKVAAGKKVRVRVTPPIKLGVDLGVFDAKKKRIGSDRSPNPGAIATVEWTPKADGEVVLRIEGRYEVGGPYTMTIEK
jgi:hypothetical protein